MTSIRSIYLLLLLPLPLGPTAQGEELTSEQLQFFENKIRPVFSENCYECHSEDAKKLKGGLLLDSKEGWMHGGDSGQVIVPGDAGKSLLLHMINHDPEYESMPPKSKLKSAEIKDIEKWINDGAPDPRDQKAKISKSSSGFDLEKRKQWWSFQPIKNYKLPVVKAKSWPSNDYDYFVLAELEKKGWLPAEKTSKESLLRRLSFDLTGLAPTRKDLDLFLSDSSPDAYAKQVDRLLASPHYGEKWARHWMDVIRYGETKSYEMDYKMPYAHRYRDYLIRAFNDDVPYDQFVRESFAGDLLEKPRLVEKQKAGGGSVVSNESLQGPGFLFLTVGQHGPPDIHEDEARVFSDVIDTATKAYLGLTVACARCHDHKFDAITTGDYYSMYGMMKSSRIDIANSISVEQQRQGEKELIQVEPQVRSLALEDALADVKNIAKYIEATQRIRKTPTYKEAFKEYLNLTDKKKKAHWKKKDGINPVALFYKTIEVVAAKEASMSGLDSVVLESWLYYSGLPEKHKQWPELEPLLRYLIAIKPDQNLGVAKTLDGIKPLYSKDFKKWMTSGPAFERSSDEGGNYYKYSLSDKRHVVQTVGDLSKPSAGVFSSRVTGAIRSPDFVLDGKPVQIYARGKDSTVRLIVRNYELAGRGPTTSILSVNVDSPIWKRISIKTDLWKGHPAYLEVIQGGSLTKALSSREKLTQMPDDAYVSISVEGVPDWQEAWANSDPVAVIEGLWKKAKGDKLSGADADVLGALFGAGLIRAGADRSPELAMAVDEYLTLSQKIPMPYFVRSLTEGTPQDEPIYIRGSHKNLSKEPNPRRFLDALGGERFPNGVSGRLNFANSMVSDSNPFISRVMVNRIWKYLFGQGIVSSVDDFGELGTLPSHPELLDYLATDFKKNGWSVKTLLRNIVMSSTYQMSSTPGAGVMEVDPSNVYLQHMPVKRLEAEAIRDHILQCSGELDPTMYGPSVSAYVDDLPAARGRPKSGPVDGAGRRSVYLELRRNYMPTFLRIFGMPNGTEPTGKRIVTNVPAQSLALMNSEFVHGQARAWAARLIKESDDPDERIKIMHEQAFGRAAAAEDIKWSQALLKDIAVTYQEGSTKNGSVKVEEITIWQELCHVMMNRKEFIYLH